MAEYIATLTDDATLQQATADKYIAAIREKQEKMDAIEALELEDDVAFWNDVKARLAQPVAMETQTEEGATAQAPETIPTPTAMDDVAVQDAEESTQGVKESTLNVESSTSVPESQIGNENGNENGNDVQGGTETAVAQTETEQVSQPVGDADNLGGSEIPNNEPVNEEGIGGAPSLLDVVRILYSKGKKVASKLFSIKFFDVAQTPKFMQELGLHGDKFTIKYGVFARHIGKDSSHTHRKRLGTTAAGITKSICYIQTDR